MNLTKPSPAISVVTLGSVDDMRERIRKKSQLKGRQADEASLREVRALIGAAPYRRDLLIEHLHRLNDTYRGLHERHLTALAKLMNLPLAEVYEVATFYHHFEVLRGDDPGPALTVRVCDGLACEMASLSSSASSLQRQAGVAAHEDSSQSTSPLQLSSKPLLQFSATSGRTNWLESLQSRLFVTEPATGEHEEMADADAAPKPSPSLSDQNDCATAPSSMAPSQSLSRLSHSSGAAGAVRRSRSLQSSALAT